jgi:hypothetical protein
LLQIAARIASLAFAIITTPFGTLPQRSLRGLHPNAEVAECNRAIFASALAARIASGVHITKAKVYGDFASALAARIASAKTHKC